ncbi:MAG: UDP-N-acetylmuramoyl-L-alanine--D-glutamate ligase [Phycisphaerales bacterium]|nr:MAG: UDP-N-acetylmuramoyl-L-alanine--D-glutamate ligase [Phycisphaerales bacterium]
MPELFAGQRVTLMGLGRFGGGGGAARWLAGQGASLLITDLCSEDQLADSLADLSDLISNKDTQLRLGGHVESDFTDCDLVVANPAVPRPWENPYLLAAREAGIHITTEIRLLAERINRDRLIGVTGTAGKSTTAAMIHHILNRAGLPAHLGGNIGGSLLPRVSEIEHDDWIVLELSSAMLHWLGDGVGFSAASGWSPHVAVLTNLQPNHLDWHGTFEHYERSKHNIFRYQRPGDHQITTDPPPTGRPLPLRIPGQHNQVNGRFAVDVVSRAVGLCPIEAGELLADFPGLPHRLQLVAERGGMQFFNDSKSTTPQATVLAVRSFDEPQRVHLIAGGYDKGIDLRAISELTSEIAGLYTIGATGPQLAATAADGSKAFQCETLDAAIERAMHRMGDRDILLLSPGCASWDQFDNYERRGEAYAASISSSICAAK